MKIVADKEARKVISGLVNKVLERVPLGQGEIGSLAIFLAKIEPFESLAPTPPKDEVPGKDTEPAKPEEE